jgi:hypothetical protein
VFVQAAARLFSVLVIVKRQRMHGAVWQNHPDAVVLFFDLEFTQLRPRFEKICRGGQQILKRQVYYPLASLAGFFFHLQHFSLLSIARFPSRGGLLSLCFMALCPIDAASADRLMSVALALPALLPVWQRAASKIYVAVDRPREAALSPRVRAPSGADTFLFLSA